ncbi:MAG: molybdopterin-dependent oxidoreductase, partial [Sphingomonadaceae bacterium]|nr:molybdopterin-dependent oxidoreductase [Sphingomonadaceae bacterium]
MRLDRRSLLVGGGATAGLLLAWGVWPRDYAPNVAVSDTETLINAFLKIDSAGQIIVVMPQLEMGQGVSTVLPQILADELGADWRMVAVQGAPVSPLYANTLLAKTFMEPDWARIAGGAGDWAIRQFATRNAMMLTGG